MSSALQQMYNFFIWIWKRSIEYIYLNTILYFQIWQLLSLFQ